MDRVTIDNISAEYNAPPTPGDIMNFLVDAGWHIGPSDTWNNHESGVYDLTWAEALTYEQWRTLWMQKKP